MFYFYYSKCQNRYRPVISWNNTEMETKKKKDEGKKTFSKIRIKNIIISMCCLLWRYMSVCVFAFWGGIISLAAAFLALLFVFMVELLVCVQLFTTHELSNPELQLWSQEEGREYKIKKKKNNKKSGWLKVLVAHLFCVIRAAQRRPDPPGLWVDSPGTLAVRLGAAPLVLQVAWEAELPYRGEGLGLLDNPKSAWSSHAKAAASGKDTRVLNSQNKERRTRDSLFFFLSPLLGHEGAHICAL